jgi:hypothetical protein
MRAVRCAAFAATILTALASPALAATPLGFVTGVVAGQPDSANILPAFNKVPGTAVANLDVPVPQAILTHGLNYVILVSLQDLSYTGTVSVFYTITRTVSGKVTTLQKAVLNKGFKSAPGQYWAWDIVGPAIPNSPGVASLNGYVRFGTSTAKLNVPIIIQ